MPGTAHTSCRGPAVPCQSPVKAFGSTCALSGPRSGTRPAPRSPGGPTRQQGPRPHRAPLQELGWRAGSREPFGIRPGCDGDLPPTGGEIQSGPWNLRWLPPPRGVLGGSAGQGRQGKTEPSSQECLSKQQWWGRGGGGSAVLLKPLSADFPSCLPSPFAPPAPPCFPLPPSPPGSAVSCSGPSKEGKPLAQGCQTRAQPLLSPGLWTAPRADCSAQAVWTLCRRNTLFPRGLRHLSGLASTDCPHSQASGTTDLPEWDLRLLQEVRSQDRLRGDRTGQETPQSPCSREGAGPGVRAPRPFLWFPGRIPGPAGPS